jgi:putative phosphoesterase
MLLGIVSDTHGNIEAIQEVIRHFMASAVDLVLHLGDDYLDMLFFEAAHLKILAVPGLYCPEYRDPTIPNRRIENLAGVNILMTHSPEIGTFDQPENVDSKENPQIDIVLYGHTHIPHIQEKNGVLWVNPGHLKAHDRRGHLLSYALMYLTPPQVDVRILTLATGQMLHYTVFTLHG